MQVRNGRRFLSVVVLFLAWVCNAQTNLTLRPAAAVETTTNQTVLEMVNAKLPEEIIITKIQTTVTKFDLSTESLVELNKKGVPSSVVKAMMLSKAGGSGPEGNQTQVGDPNDPSSPHEPGIYLYTEASSGRKMILLEPTVYTQGKSGGVFASAMTYGIAKVKWKAVVRNQHANVRVADPNAVFYFYFEETNAGLSHSNFWSGSTTSPNEFTLLRFDVKNDSRETVVMKAGITGASTGTDDKANTAFTHTKVRPGVYKVTPTQPLQPGEYGFISAVAMGAYAPGAASANRVFDFGVIPPE